MAESSQKTDTPDKELFTQAQRAFEAGDFRQVRAAARKLADSGNPEIARAARELRARVEPDPVHILALLACLAFFFAIACAYLFRH